MHLVLMQFGKYLIKVLIDSNGKINVMQSSFTRKLGLYIRKTDVGAQKIDGSRLEIFTMVIAFFLIEDKDERSRFFEKIFPLADIGLDVVLGMLFLTWSNVKVQFTN